MRQSSIMACDQCGSPYKFRKSRFVGLATNRALILLFSCFLFVTLIWTVGFTAECVVRRWDTPALDTSTSSKNSSGKSKASAGNGVWQYIFGEDDEVASHSYGDYDNDVYTYGYGYVSSVYWEPLSYIRLVKSAVKHVGSGRATKAVKQLFRGGTADTAKKAIEEADEKEMSWHAALIDDWKYGSGGIWEGQRPDEDSLDNKGASSTVARKRMAEQDRYDARTATELKPGQKPPRGNTTEDAIEISSLWERLTMQFSLGFSLVGIFSFINLLLGVSFWGPFHLGNFGLGRSFARLTGGGRRRGGGGGGGGGSDGGTIASVILLFLVIIGILRALMAVISLTTYMSKRLLTRVEDYIVEYSGEEERPAQATPTQAEQPNRGRIRQWWGR